MDADRPSLRSNGEGDPQFSTTFHRWLKLTRSIKAVNKTLLKAENQIDGFLKLPIRFLLKKWRCFYAALQDNYGLSCSKFRLLFR